MGDDLAWGDDLFRDTGATYRITFCPGVCLAGYYLFAHVTLVTSAGNAILQVHDSPYFDGQLFATSQLEVMLLLHFYDLD